MIHPISYSFPAEKIVPYISFKTEHLAKHNYQFTNEDEYLINYRKAFFGGTYKRAGWDCLRHYEILSQGTIPYFYNLESLPPKTMVNFPKQLVLDLNEKYYPKTLEEIYKESSSIVYNDLDSLLRYTRENLTTEKSAEYIIQKMNKESAKNILIVTNLLTTECDYLLSMITHGFKMKMKNNIDCYPDFDYHYQDYSEEKTSKMYGRGFNYTRLIPTSYKNYKSREQIEKEIINHSYDFVVVYLDEYSDNHLPFLIRNYYENENIALICGKDCDAMKDKTTGGWTTAWFHNCAFKELSKLQNVFIRELGY